MALFWGLSINNDMLVKCAMDRYENDLSFPTGDSGAWGLRYYYKGELLKRIEPREQGEPLDVSSITRGLRADIILMHTRTATSGSMRPENIHPFRFKEWIFAHNGTLAGFDAYRKKIIAAMPQFIKRGVKGDTDTQHLFHLFISFLYDAGVFGRPDLGIIHIRDALNRAVATVDEFAGECGEQPSKGSFAVSDGYSLVVLSRGIPIDYILIEGVRDCAVCRRSIIPGEDPSQRVDHEDLRAVLVRSGPFEEPPASFQRLNENSFLMITKNHGVEFSPFV
jgi:hypothetical protein